MQYLAVEKRFLVARDSQHGEIKNMAARNVSQVGVSGPTFASLLYEVANSRWDQEGFLIGEVTTRVTDGISDSQLNYEKEEVIISVHYVVPCDSLASFYNCKGHINEGVVKKCLGTKFKDLIGWYRFRRHTTLDVFLRERIVHENLSRLLPPQRKPFFLLALFNGVTSENIATHTVDHVFLRNHSGTFEGLPVSIVNLGDTSQSDYKKAPPIVLDPQGEIYGHLTNSTKNSPLDHTGATSSIDHVRCMQTALQRQLRRLCQSVSNSELQITDLKDEIKMLNALVNKAKIDSERNLGDPPPSIKTEVQVTAPEGTASTAIEATKYSASELQKTIGRLTLTSNKTVFSSLPKDVSSIEHNLRKVGRPFPEPSQLKIQAVNLEERQMDNTILADTGGCATFEKEIPSLPKL